ncbi:cytochrome c oxidase subunit 3 [Microvirga sp. 2YAF29]|uniref:cytochrome c oxidase subunit 3 n=1 Tax=Microvirga sp. 2YAF29 TaxID=3233031 RepID=UPI003F9B13C4
MASILALLSLLAVIATWWLIRQGITSKPWLEQGVSGSWTDDVSAGLSKEKVGLGVFIAVASSLFALFISAYAMRMQMADWRDLPIPRLLWLNTGILFLSSIALHRASRAARDRDFDTARIGLLAAGITALAFVSGQLLAWRQLTNEGYWLTSNSANAFFYVLTGLHGLHLLGGMAVLGFVIEKSWRARGLEERQQLTIQLCTTYWDFLLVAWLVLFGVMTGWAGELVDLCRQILF